MPRHIDADKVMEEIARIGGHNLCEWNTIGVKALIDRQPTADVALRAEVEELQAECNKWQERLKTECEYTEAITKKKVAREIFAEIESEIFAALQSNYRAKQERVKKQLPDDFVSYMCEGKIAALRGIGAFVEELKNKYAEGEK